MSQWVQNTGSGIYPYLIAFIRPEFTRSLDVKAQIINHILKRNYYLARFVYSVWFSINLRHENVLVVFQMGKVGSTSVVLSLQAAGLDMPVVQVHALTKRGIKDMERRYYGDKRSILQGSLLPETRHLYASYNLHTKLGKKRNENALKIVTLVRDPVARNVSEFFYSVDTTKNKPYLPDFYRRFDAGIITTEEIIQQFLDSFNEESEDFHLPLDWFDREFAPATGIDVYSIRFNKNKGYLRYREEGIDVLLLKLEHLDKCAGEAFQEFLELPNFWIPKANLAAQRRYYPAYKEFIKKVRMPDSYLRKMYQSKYVQHFYTVEEIEAFWKKWHK